MDFLKVFKAKGPTKEVISNTHNINVENKAKMEADLSIEEQRKGDIGKVKCSKNIQLLAVVHKLFAQSFISCSLSFEIFFLILFKKA